MSDAYMPAQRQATMTAIEAHDVVALHRTPDRDYRCPCLFRRRCAPQIAEGSTHLSDQPGELIDADLMMPYIATDNSRD
jgi:hypothetical protein